MTMKIITAKLAAKLATPEARAMDRAVARAMQALDVMPTTTSEDRAAHADAVDRFLDLADRYDVFIYGPIAR